MNTYEITIPVDTRQRIADISREFGIAGASTQRQLEIALEYIAEEVRKWGPKAALYELGGYLEAAALVAERHKDG